jgi:general L-amino acid transport system permease protein
VTRLLARSGWWRAIQPWHVAATAACSVGAAWVFWVLLDFLVLRAVWTGADRSACLPQGTGACWAFILAKFPQLVYGFYPAGERWRANAVFATGVLLLIPLLLPKFPAKWLNAVLLFLVFPVSAFAILQGGMFGLAPVSTRQWGGLTVTLLVALCGISASLPLGIGLALARRSALPVVRLAASAFIEFWRGVPLVTVLFFAVYVLPIFLPRGWTFDGLVRVTIGISLFASAYMAEVVRGGLQSIPRGQYEAARALGLRHWPMMHLVVLPQSLRLVIPGIVNTFIMLFKDTTLVLIVSVLDLLGQLRAAESDPEWATPVTEITGFAFAGLVYFTFCFSMSSYSRSMERRLGAGRSS